MPSHVFDGTNQRQAKGDTSGRAVVIGDQTPTNNVATPTNAVPANSFLMGFDGTNWRFVACDTTGTGGAGLLQVAFGKSAATVSSDGGFAFSSTYNITQAAMMLRNEQGASTTASIGARANNRGDLFVVQGLPDPSATTQTQNSSGLNDQGIATRVKNSAGSLLEVVASNSSGGALWFQIHDKGSAAPVNTDVPIWEVYVPAGTAFRAEWFRHIHCANGIGFCWSTTANAATLAGATGGNASIRYA